MIGPSRRPSRMLIIHDGNDVDAYISFLQQAGLQATETHADEAVAQAFALDPDIIVLDFDCDGETLAALNSNVSTRGIPVIALADLPPVSEPMK